MGARGKKPRFYDLKYDTPGVHCALMRERVKIAQSLVSRATQWRVHLFSYAAENSARSCADSHRFGNTRRRPGVARSRKRLLDYPFVDVFQNSISKIIGSVMFCA